MKSTSAGLRIDAPELGVVPYLDVEAWAAATAKPGDYFDELAAEHARGFFPRFLRHTKGKWSGHPFDLSIWQRSLIRTVFGWKRADGLRRFRIVYLEIGRKNGKTALAAGVALYLAFASGENGAEVYCAASNEDQANLCFGEAKRMRGQSSTLRAQTDAFKKNISKLDTFSKLEVLTSKSDTKDGLNVSGLIADEFRKWTDRNLYAVLHTAQGAREQPLELLITTGGDGNDMDGICWEIREHAIKVRDGIVEDHELLPVIYAADKEDPIADPATWAKANPNLGVTIKPEFLAKEAAKTILLPRYLDEFRKFYLDIWTDAAETWVPREAWDCCNLRPVTIDAIRGRRCFGGLDLSSVTDLTALALYFPADDGLGGDLWVHHWMPREGIEERVRRDRVPYDRWSREGLITLTDGNVVDYDAIRWAITGTDPEGRYGEHPAAWGAPLVEIVDLVEIARDRWNASHLTNQLMSDDVTMIEFGQGFGSMSAPAKEWEKLILARQLNHGGNALLRWENSCTSIVTDESTAGNIKPVKPDRKKSYRRIDGIVAGIMALGRAIAPPDPKAPPVVSLPPNYRMVVA